MERLHWLAFPEDGLGSGGGLGGGGLGAPLLEG